jgi:hypothetical protein
MLIIKKMKKNTHPGQYTETAVVKIICLFFHMMKADIKGIDKA